MRSCCRGALHQYATQHGYTGRCVRLMRRLVQWENPGVRAASVYVSVVLCDTCRSRLLASNSR